MATRFIDKNSSPDTTNCPNLPDAAGICVDDGVLVYNNGSAIVPANSGGAPVALTAGATLSAQAHAGRTVIVNAAAGAAIVLPAATGTGNKYRIVIGTALATGDLTVAPTGDDTFAGFAIVEDAGDSTPSDATIFPTAAGATILITVDQAGGGGAVGNFIEVEDIKTDVWATKVYISGLLDAATPFSS